MCCTLLDRERDSLFLFFLNDGQKCSRKENFDLGGFLDKQDSCTPIEIGVTHSHFRWIFFECEQDILKPAIAHLHKPSPAQNYIKLFDETARYPRYVLCRARSISTVIPENFHLQTRQTALPSFVASLPVTPHYALKLPQ